MNPKPFSQYRTIRLICLLPLLSAWLLSAGAHAQVPSPDDPKVAAVTLDTATLVMPRRNKSVFQLVGVRPSQTVSIAMAYPGSLAGQAVSIEPLDGGRAIVPQQGMTIGLDGTLTFQFQVGSLPGLYQVRVHRAASVVALQFWALDNQHLENSPPVLTGN